MDEPRPTTISARPRDSKSSVANSLEQPDRVGGAQHRHGAREADALGARGRRAEDDGRGRVEELAAVVLADPERIQPEPIGVLDLLDQVAQAVRRR